jgi:hypothetical protein
MLDIMSRMLYSAFMPIESASDDGSRWSVRSMLTCGSLGENNAAARRYYRRSMAALPVLALCMAAASYVPGGRYVMAIAPGLFFLYIAVEFRRYMFAQDELARRIHFESIVMTYLTALAVAGAVGWLYAIARRY